MGEWGALDTSVDAALDVSEWPTSSSSPMKDKESSLRSRYIPECVSLAHAPFHINVTLMCL